MRGTSGTNSCRRLCRRPDRSDCRGRGRRRFDFRRLDGRRRRRRHGHRRHRRRGRQRSRRRRRRRPRRRRGRRRGSVVVVSVVVIVGVVVVDAVVTARRPRLSVSRPLRHGSTMEQTKEAAKPRRRRKGMSRRMRGDSDTSSCRRPRRRRGRGGRRGRGRCCSHFRCRDGRPSRRFPRHGRPRHRRRCRRHRRRRHRLRPSASSVRVAAASPRMHDGKSNGVVHKPREEQEEKVEDEGHSDAAVVFGPMPLFLRHRLRRRARIW